MLARRYVAEGFWDDASLGAVLSAGLHDAAAQPFTVRSDRRPYRGTLGDVDALARRVATGLRARGIGPGDPVAFQLPNWMEAAATFYADRLPRRDRRADRALLRSEGGVVHPAPHAR